jgi:hypothetical protein
MDDHQAHEGGCFCGDIRYAVEGPSVWKAVCYCDSCTRASGAPAIAWTGIPKNRFRLLRGRLTIFESSRGILRGFCGRCGTTLTYQKDPQTISGARDDVYIATRTLDDPSAYLPDEHVFYGERVAWFEAGDDKPRHESLSEDYAHLQLLTLTGADEAGRSNSAERGKVS